MLTYRIAVEPDDNGTYLVTSPDLPEVTTFAEALGDELLKIVIAAIEEAIAARISANQELPVPMSGAGETVARLPLLTSLKAMLYAGARNDGVTRAELGRRLGWHREQVDRLFRLDHASRLDQIEAAFHALGQELRVEVEAAA